jgi:hypothetical protein
MKEMELPREVQLHILRYLYDPWRPRWNRVMKELSEVQYRVRYWTISRFMVKDWNLTKPKHYMICLDCGNYYNLPMYGCLAMYCDCP